MNSIVKRIWTFTAILIAFFGFGTYASVSAGSFVSGTPVGGLDLGTYTITGGTVQGSFTGLSVNITGIDTTINVTKTIVGGWPDPTSVCGTYTYSIFNNHPTTSLQRSSWTRSSGGGFKRSYDPFYSWLGYENGEWFVPYVYYGAGYVGSSGQNSISTCASPSQNTASGTYDIKNFGFVRIYYLNNTYTGSTYTIPETGVTATGQILGFLTFDNVKDTSPSFTSAVPYDATLDAPYMSGSGLGEFDVRYGKQVKVVSTVSGYNYPIKVVPYGGVEWSLNNSTWYSTGGLTPYGNATQLYLRKTVSNTPETYESGGVMIGGNDSYPSAGDPVQLSFNTTSKDKDVFLDGIPVGGINFGTFLIDETTPLQVFSGSRLTFSGVNDELQLSVIIVGGWSSPGTGVGNNYCNSYYQYPIFNNHNISTYRRNSVGRGAATGSYKYAYDSPQYSYIVYTNNDWMIPMFSYGGSNVGYSGQNSISACASPVSPTSSGNYDVKKYGRTVLYYYNSSYTGTFTIPENGSVITGQLVGFMTLDVAKDSTVDSATALTPNSFDTDTRYISSIADGTVSAQKGKTIVVNSTISGINTSVKVIPYGGIEWKNSADGTWKSGTGTTTFGLNTVTLNMRRTLNSNAGVFESGGLIIGDSYSYPGTGTPITIKYDTISEDKDVLVANTPFNLGTRFLTGGTVNQILTGSVLSFSGVNDLIETSMTIVGGWTQPGSYCSTSYQYPVFNQHPLTTSQRGYNSRSSGTIWRRSYDPYYQWLGYQNSDWFIPNVSYGAGFVSNGGGSSITACASPNQSTSNGTYDLKKFGFTKFYYTNYTNTGTYVIPETGVVVNGQLLGYFTIITDTKTKYGSFDFIGGTFQPSSVGYSNEISLSGTGNIFVSTGTIVKNGLEQPRTLVSFLNGDNVKIKFQLPGTAGVSENVNVVINDSHDVVTFTTTSNVIPTVSSIASQGTFITSNNSGSVTFSYSGLTDPNDGDSVSLEYSWNDSNGTYNEIVNLTGALNDYSGTFAVSATQLPDGTNTLYVRPKDLVGTGNTVSVDVIKDSSELSLIETTPISPLSSNINPSYSFSSTKTGSVSYSGACGTGTLLTAFPGINSMTYSNVPYGTHSDCKITVTDSVGQTRSLTVTSFKIADMPTSLLDFAIDENGPDFFGTGTSSEATVGYDVYTDVSGTTIAGTFEGITVSLSNSGTDTETMFRIYDDSLGSWSSWMDASQTATIDSNDRIMLKRRISDTVGFAQNSMVTIEGPVVITSRFSTLSVSVDKTFDAVNFGDKTNIALSTQVESDAVTISGMTPGATVEITASGGTLSINGGAFSQTGTLKNGDTLKLKTVSSDTPAEQKTVDATIQYNPTLSFSVWTETPDYGTYVSPLLSGTGYTVNNGDTVREISFIGEMSQGRTDPYYVGEVKTQLVKMMEFRVIDLRIEDPITGLRSQVFRLNKPEIFNAVESKEDQLPEGTVGTKFNGADFQQDQLLMKKFKYTVARYQLK